MQKFINSRYVLVACPWALEDAQNDAQIGITKDVDEFAQAVRNWRLKDLKGVKVENGLIMLSFSGYDVEITLCSSCSNAERHYLLDQSPSSR